MMRTSQNGIDFIKSWEGCALKAYRDVAGVLTIGYGHTEGFRSGALNPDSEITEGYAEYLLTKDLISREETVHATGITLNQNQFDALVSFEFNTGGLLRSTALKRLREGNFLSAAEALTWWNKARIGGKIITAPGLTRRRAAEADLFLTPVPKAKTPARQLAGRRFVRAGRLCLR